MTYSSTVTQKGQVTIPKRLRDSLGIKKNQKVTIEQEKDYIKISPTEDILDLAGSLKDISDKPILESREAFENNYSRV
jgi:AbrB family looped-hinge helix DNA binding protein